MNALTIERRRYAKDAVCAFRFTNAQWGELSNFYPLQAPIVAGPWRFTTSEALYQAAKFAGNREVQQRIAQAPSAREAKRIGRSPANRMSRAWDAQRVNVMRWVLRMKREAARIRIDAVLEASAERAIVEVSMRDQWWGAYPFAARYEGRNVLGRLWMELRAQLRSNHTLASARAWSEAISVGALTDPAAQSLRTAEPVI